ncbi:MAG: hypothetical protein ABIM50_13355 [Novosphingobium sp.]
MLALAGEAEGSPRAFLRIGPASLARFQLSLALALECQRIVCISRRMSSELVDLQAVAERAGARFHVIAGPRALSGLVTANDEVVVIADGLLAPVAGAAALLEGRHCVVVQGVDSGIAAGFERIDLNHASAGLMRIPGRLIERLQELPADCDAVSALTRIALQAGIEQRPLPSEARDGLRWKLIRNETEAHAAEAGWIGEHLDGDEPHSPGTWLARRAVRGFGPAILHAGSGGNIVAICSGVVVFLGLGIGWAGFPAIALVLCGLAWITRRAGAQLQAIESDSLALPSARWPRLKVFDWTLDIALIAILVWNTDALPQSPLWQRGFAPLMVICLARLLPRISDRKWAYWLADRALLALALAIAAGSEQLTLSVLALAAAIGLFAVSWPADRLRLT